MSSQLQVTFGDCVRDRRLALGITQAELAEKLKMHAPDVCDLEKGRHAPTLETVEKIAKALRVSPASLLENKLRQVAAAS